MVDSRQLNQITVPDREYIRVSVPDRDNELLDERAYYLTHRLKNKQAVGHLFDEVDKIYDRLEDNPFQFPTCRDEYLKRMGYREAVLKEMNYILVFRIEYNMIYVPGIFHQLENYCIKCNMSIAGIN